MKTTAILKAGLICILFTSINLISNNCVAQEKPGEISKTEVDISISIDNQTTSEDLKEIEEILSDYGITVEFSAIRRNDLKELTGIRIELFSDSGRRSSAQIASNEPLSEISFGRKEGELFISQGGNAFGMFSMFPGQGMNSPFMQNDSLWSGLMRQFQFDFNDFFNSDNSLFFGGQSDSMDQFRKQIQELMESRKDPFSNNFAPKQGFRFYDNPNTNKLIIIDGEMSDFPTLDKLAKADQIDTVDVLQPKTAVSIYGEKARDGAIIVTTKEKN